MNILQTIIIKIAHVIAAVIVVLSISAVPNPTVTTIDLPVPTVQETPPSQTPTPPDVQPTPTSELPILPNLVVTPDQTSAPISAIIPVVTQPAPTPENPNPPPTTVYVPVYIIQPPQPTPTPTPTPSPSPAPTPTPPPVITHPTPMTTLEIISPLSGKGLGRQYHVSPTYPELQDDSNYIELGLIVRDDSGQAQSTEQVSITATDSSQDKDLDGTGNITATYPGGVKTMVPFYPFHYEFKTAGEHTITFQANGVTQAVTINVQ